MQPDPKFVPPLDPEEHKGSRRLALTLLASLITLLFVVVFSQTAFDLTFLRPNGDGQIQVFAALSLLIFLLFVALTYVLARTVLKLWSERRMGTLGSKFRTRMVVGALLLSLGPVIFVFFFAYGLMNRSIDKWFSRPVEEVRQDTAAMASLLGEYANQNAHAEAETLAAEPGTLHAFATGNFSEPLSHFREHDRTLQGGFVVVLQGENPAATYQLPAPWPEMRTLIARATMDKDKAARGNAAQAKKNQAKDTQSAIPPPLLISVAGVDYVISQAPVLRNSSILVGMPLPSQFTATANRVAASQQRYTELSSKRKLFRQTYLGVLGLLTMLVLFTATWFALLLSKQVTRPVEALARATEEISAGRLNYRIAVTGPDELGDLVLRFNRMAADLESSRQLLTSSTHDLGEANQLLDRRRQQIEAILENIPTGVMSLDANRRVTHVNDALRRIFDFFDFHDPPLPASSGEVAGKLLTDFLPEEIHADLDFLLRRADRMGNTTSPMELQAGHRTLHVAVTVASLTHGAQKLGWVVVFEDLSDLMQAQREAAWREVARQVAHEIKNPLTPIALSAERISRHLSQSEIPPPRSLSIIRKCAETIAASVTTVRSLVDEFAALARFPKATPEPADINAIIESTLAMFDGRLPGIRLSTSLADGLPLVMADPNALKRALANLVDNAAEAMDESILREIHIGTSLLDDRSAVEVVVADTGHGVTQDMKEKLFLPYFSTKQRGTGLGLSIVSRTVEDHRGSIRVEENQPVGTRFVLELPLAAPSPESAVAEGLTRAQ